MAEHPTRYWSVSVLKGRLKSFTKKQLHQVSTLLTGACWGGYVARTSLTEKTLGFRLLPEDWPDKEQARKDILDVMSDRQPRNKAELSNAVSQKYLAHPCEVVFDTAITAAVQDGVLERSQVQRQFAFGVSQSRVDLQLVYRQWLLSQVPV